MNDLGPSHTYYQMKTADLMRAYSKASKAGAVYEAKHGSTGNRQRRIAEDIKLVLRQRGVLASAVA